MTGAAGERVVLVTGAASGIGLATAARCAADGMAVGLLDRDATALRAAVALVAGTTGEGPTGARVVEAVADVSDAAAVADAVDSVARRLGRLDAVVNAAGIGGYSGDVATTPLERWERTLAVNLTGTFLVCRAALAHLRAAGAGRVVNVSSQFGLVGGAGSPAYAASKSGLIGLTRAMAVDHAPEGILVNCVCPGPIDTPMLRASQGDKGPAATSEAERTRRRSLLGAPGRPEDVAGTIAFLLGPDAGHITGAVLAVDGGWTAG
ncbi:MAG: SDR family NAD(P)-dependent oxidoreductase [Acidimicrobiales bacterium]